MKYSFDKICIKHYKRMHYNSEHKVLTKTMFLVDEGMNITSYNDIKNNIRFKTIQIWLDELKHHKYFSFKIK